MSSSFRFYIGCDVCADWLHGACVNLTPEEADKFEVYVCPRCSTEKKQEFLNQLINGERQTDVLNLIEQLSVKRRISCINAMSHLPLSLSRHTKWPGHSRSPSMEKTSRIITRSSKNPWVCLSSNLMQGTLLLSSRSEHIEKQSAESSISHSV